MKKLLLVLLFILLSATKCDKNKIESEASYVYERSYGINQETESINDIFVLLNKYGQDSVPLSKWPGYIGTNDKGMLIQQVLTKYTDSINYAFIYNTYKYSDTTYYGIKVRKFKIINKE